MPQADNSRAPTRLKLTPDHAQLARLEAWVQDFAIATELPARTRFGLELVITEAVTNVMDHSQNAGGVSTIEVICALRDDHLSAEVIDDGAPFDPTSRAVAAPPANLDEASPGGLGIHLMRRYTSSMEYGREQNRNVLRMTLPVAPETHVS
jgi:anti-sigma regulatory factor (Ser/Thr protein kinase)